MNVFAAEISAIAASAFASATASLLLRVLLSLLLLILFVDSTKIVVVNLFVVVNLVC